MLGWIANHESSTPRHNISPLELRGRKWVKDKIKSKTIFITKADKGGAILIMNFEDVQRTIESEIYNESKFEKILTTAEQHIFTIRDRVNATAINLQSNGFISKEDKSLITGLSDKNKAKQAPEYRAESPYAYPSFKIHKLSKEEIEAKEIPPVRLIHASKFSPLYRCEKWCSPHLTRMSREYCGEEFLLDTKHLLNSIKDLNSNITERNQNINLFTLDVEKLYPSIQPRYIRFFKTKLYKLFDCLSNF